MATKISAKYVKGDKVSFISLDAQVVEAQEKSLVVKGDVFNTLTIDYKSIETLIVDGTEVEKITQEGVGAELVKAEASEEESTDPVDPAS